jgi:hypothetical protein
MRRIVDFGLKAVPLLFQSLYGQGFVGFYVGPDVADGFGCFFPHPGNSL